MVARIGNETITAEDLDAGIRLPLHDLDRARHALRAERLEQLVMTRVLGVYWAYHDALFQQQDDLGRVALERQAERVGLDRTRFVACLDADRMREEVAGDAAAARAIGVTVAPTFFVSGAAPARASPRASARRSRTWLRP